MYIAEGLLTKGNHGRPVACPGTTCLSYKLPETRVTRAELKAFFTEGVLKAGQSHCHTVETPRVNTGS
jgi:hypothetical protein